MTDATGSYGLTWIPDIPGNFVVIAHFDGTKGYWPSSAETSFSVDQPTATPTQQTQIITASDQYLLPGIAAIIIAIAIVGAILLVAIRKRP
jgi:hypothetical protein